MTPKTKQSLTELVDTTDVQLINSGKYANLYEVQWDGEPIYEVLSNTTFEVIYRTYSYNFATRRFQETNEE